MFCHGSSREQCVVTDRLHICFLTLSFGENSAGGVMHHMVALAREFAAHGDSISVICPSYGAPWRYLHDGFIDVIGIREVAIDRRLAPAMIGFGRRTRVALLSLHGEKPIDVIHLHDRPPWLGAAAAARDLRVPLVYTAHSLIAADRTGSIISRTLQQVLERRIARARVPIIAVSRWAREGMIDLGARPDDVTVISNGVDLEAFQYRAMEGRKPNSILFVGRLDAEKGLDVLLRATALLDPKTRVRVTVIGAGHLEGSYHRLAAELGIESRVEFAGRQSGAQLATPYQRSAICVLPSRVEPFPLVMLEAMAAGAPFIGSAVGGIREAVIPGETGLLVAPDDPRELAGALARLLDDPALTDMRVLELDVLEREIRKARRYGPNAAAVFLLYPKQTPWTAFFGRSTLTERIHLTIVPSPAPF